MCSHIGIMSCGLFFFLPASPYVGGGVEGKGKELSLSLSLSLPLSLSLMLSLPLPLSSSGRCRLLSACVSEAGGRR